MLHFMPADPLGQVESTPNVQCSEHTGWPSMSIEPVHTPLSHSVELSLTTVHAAPKLRGAGPPASGPGAGASPEQAARANHTARTRRCIASNVTVDPLSDRRRECDLCVTPHDAAITGSVSA